MIGTSVIDLDGGVVDAHAAQRGQNMLGGGNQRSFGHQHRRKLGCD